MTTTTETTPEEYEPPETLYERLDEDDEDRPPCPNCHEGVLLPRDEAVVCSACHCTRDGTYVPPKVSEHRTSFSGSQTHLIGPTDRSVDVEGNDREKYSNGTVRLYGGFEAVYDEDGAVRPDGVTAEYTFDLSTLDGP